MSPVPCELFLEVFEPASLEYDASSSSDVVAWDVSTNPSHARPWLLAPRQYAEQEIDPIACTATIGQVEIGVIDVPEVSGDQDTGWMTARVHDLMGRRCRLTRYIDATIGWIVIADGPAGNPSMDGSYSAYRWTIRDTRETERKLSAFQFGGTAGVVPRGSIYGFGYYTDQTGDHVLLSPLLDDAAPVMGIMGIENVGGQWIGTVDFGIHFVPQVDPGAPTAETVHIWEVSLESIDQWANGWRAEGQDPYDMSSGHGNQGLDAIIVSNGITVADFNAQAIALGVSFGPGTAWIESYRDALVTALAQPSTQPLASLIDDARLAMDEDAVEATQTTEVLSNIFGARTADVLWRVQGDTIWNVSRPMSPVNLVRSFVETEEIADGAALRSVLLFNDTAVPDDFPGNGALVEVIIRHRGPASEAFPYYLEGTMGDVLTNFYNGAYSLAPLEGIEGVVYDPSGADDYATDAATVVRYDPIPFASMVEPVLLRQDSAVTDGRTWTEEKFYAPSGWIPALDNDAIISPILRNRPQTIDPTLALTNARTVPTAGWNIGQRTVSEVVYTYSRFFVPGVSDNFEVEPDGLAIRPITVLFRDPDSERRYGQQVVSYDASAFSAVGDHAGHSIVGTQETAGIMAQAANLDILERYRAGVQTFSINARRNAIPSVRVGTWVPWDLSWLPSRMTGLRGSIADAAQIISIRDNDCVWRTITLEESAGEGSLGGQPGLVDTLVVLETDEQDPGLADTAVVLSDEVSMDHEYLFRGDLTDEKGGPSLVGSGTVGAESYVFDANEGLTLENAIGDGDVYTIVMRWKLNDLSRTNGSDGYCSVLSFKGTAVDQGGLYAAVDDWAVADPDEEGYIYYQTTPVIPEEYYDFSSASFESGVMANLIVTRALDKTMKFYVNGVLRMTVADTGDDGIFSDTDNVMHFFKQDNYTDSEQPGEVTYIGILLRVATAAEVAELAARV